MADDPDEEIAAVGDVEEAAGLVPGDKILVTVESALPDILVVSYERGSKSFQGALLHANKRGLPCGVQPPEPIKDPDGDKLSTIAARFSYFQEKRHTALGKPDLRRNTNPPARSKGTRPTVRLRPRQVLCSKCRSICNENSENVGRKRKPEEPSPSEQPTRRSDRRLSSQQQQQSQPPQNTRSQRLLHVGDQSDESSSSKTTSSSQSDAQSHNSKFSASLIPKLSRLRPAEIGNAMQSTGSSVKLAEPAARGVYWNGRDDEGREAVAEEEVENRPMNALSSSRPEPMELDSNPTQAYCATPRRLSSSSVESAKIPPDEEDKKTLAAADSTVKSGGRTVRATRKKRSIGLMEDLWDESVFEDPARTTTATRATPVIKISFGAQGEGTVLKIPSKIQHPYLSRDMDTDTEEAQTELERDPLELPKSYDGSGFESYRRRDAEDDGQEQVDPQRQGLSPKDCETASTKAAKKALKKAKKKALRKMYGAISPARSPCNGSPRYNSNFDKMLYHRRKHKVKHKKKHKEERKHKSQSSSSSSSMPLPSAQQLDCLGQPVPMDTHHHHHQHTADEQQNGTEQQQQQQQHSEQDDTTTTSTYTAIKEQCLKQKLSISLKRLNTNAYATTGYQASSSNASSTGCKTSEDDEEEDDDDEEECTGHANGEEVSAAETAPDFPPPEHPLVMRLSAAATPVEHCLTAAGRRMDVGDVVWGKVHGFPWWPGKVLSITDSGKEDSSSLGPQAHVAWYGSSTSSLMSCDQLSPFLETFKTRYNKKKKGPYKEAIRQAQSEARSQMIAPLPPPPTSTPGSVLDVCGSPREVNVLS